ncbi:MAG: DUF1700 domain-containing protein [Clostridia bacterium]|nr:DUF1700 domain-containing protein [Clostridia bacterium]
MNRQQFLAELSQYLTFFSPEEKAQIISAYNEKFNSAGSENEAALLAELGTPMMTAIDLKRRVEAGEQISFAPENDITETEAAPENSVETEAVSGENDEPAVEEAPAPLEDEAPAEPNEEAPAEENPQDSPTELIGEPSAEAYEAVPLAESPQEAPESPVEEIPQEKPVAIYPAEIPEAPYEYPLAPSAPFVVDAKPKKPKRKVSVAKLIGAFLLSIIITAFFLAIASIGVVLLVAMSYLLLAGLKNLVYVTDCLLLFGGGLVCAGLGLLVVWFALWSAVSMIFGLFRNALGYGSVKEGAAV